MLDLLFQVLTSSLVNFLIFIMGCQIIWREVQDMKSDGRPSLYPDLYTPTSPSWSLHWTFRDEQLVNLPVSLLVEGDVIALRPGQEAFASLRGIKVMSE